MDRREPKMTIITSVLNGSATLGRLLDSLAAQHYPEWEHIVMDGGSTDGTVDLLQARRSRIAYFESAPDRGIYHAWNKALEHAAGEWYCFLGADDFLWDAHVLDRIAPHLAAAAGEYRIVYGTTNVMTAAGEILAQLGEPWAAVRPKMRENMALPNPSTFYHRDLFTEHGAFDEAFSIAGDYEFVLRELRRGEALFIEGLVVAGMQEGGRSVNRAHAVETVRQVLEARHRHGFSRIPVRCHPRLLRVRLHTRLARLLGEEAALRIVNRYRAVAGRPPLP